MQQIMLIRVTGDDRPGLTAGLTEVLAHHHVDVVDVNQAVIHRQLLLGMLIRMPGDINAAMVLGELQMQASQWEMRLSARVVSADEYEAWVARQGKPRHILTLLARTMTGARLAAVSRTIADQGMNIDVITRLTGRPPLVAREGPQRACVELSVRGEPADADGFHAELMRISRELDCDVAWQEDNAYRRVRRLVAFDMDSTLIQAEVIDELAREAGVGDEVAAVTEAAMRGELDFGASLRRRVGLLKGLDEAALKRVAQRLELTEGAEHLIGQLRRLGYKTAIISGGFSYFGEVLRQRLGIDYVCANELEIEHGRLTGRVIEPIVDGQRKAELVREIAGREGIRLEQVIAVGDGANDLPMLNQAGLGIAFHAKPVVQDAAEHQISTLGLDGILYLLGVRDRDLPAYAPPTSEHAPVRR
ncbi:MAG: phosphoserine phosphatase SerB [Phycisphaeraceae bacterium]